MDMQASQICLMPMFFKSLSVISATWGLASGHAVSPHPFLFPHLYYFPILCSVFLIPIHFNSKWVSYIFLFLCANSSP